jgi:MoxR-like ATPase
MKAAQAFAFLYNRDYVIPDDIQYLAPFTLAHRMILRSEAKFEGKRPEAVLQDIMSKTEVPVRRPMSN